MLARGTSALMAAARRICYPWNELRWVVGGVVLSLVLMRLTGCWNHTDCGSDSFCYNDNNCYYCGSDQPCQGYTGIDGSCPAKCNIGDSHFYIMEQISNNRRCRFCCGPTWSPYFLELMSKPPLMNPSLTPESGDQYESDQHFVKVLKFHPDRDMLHVYIQSPRKYPETQKYVSPLRCHGCIYCGCALY